MPHRASLNESINQYYVSATAALPKTRILKNENTFAIFDVKGDVYPVGNDELGIYNGDTRYLSRFLFFIGETEEPLLLNSFIRKENDYFKVELTNPDIKRDGMLNIKKSTLYISRTKFLDNVGCDEEICFFNYTDETVELPIAIEFDADYRDVFEIRGMTRKKKGQRLPTEMHGVSAVLGYRGLDEIERFTTLNFQKGTTFISDHRAVAQVCIPPHEAVIYQVKIRFSERKPEFNFVPFEKGLKNIHETCALEKCSYAEVRSSSDDFNLWLHRSRNDLIMMTTTTSEGHRYPYAGIPWYCTAFGRDGIWTALLCLWVNPEMAREALLFLAKTQATETSKESDATPGKIFHEMRTCEMANLKEVPFGKYYGTVDATPLYLMLAGEYFDRTGDLETIKQLWPSLMMALQWIDEYGDEDKDGFVEYRTDSEKGLLNQGWKDSHDSIFHANGDDPKGPIALCEVQGYVYAAKTNLIKLALEMGEQVLADKLRIEAAELKEHFDRSFWIPSLNTYAIALDGKKRPCKILSSNAGHLFYCGIMKPERLRPLANTLMSEVMFSGFGVRTVGKGERRYNPISYHNGSVWPHDTTIIALGMARYGFKAEVGRIFQGLFRASTFMEHNRMPEVFCGFELDNEPPTLYPVACSPQAWAAASVYGLIAAVLGLEINAKIGQIRCFKPTLPDCIEQLRIHGLRLQDSTIDLAVERHQEDVSIRLLSRKGSAHLVIEK